jgi:hypothetical protein
VPLPKGEPAQQAAALVDEAFSVANAYPEARSVAVSTAAPLLARLPASTEESRNRDTLTGRWLNLALSKDVSRASRLSAFDSFFETASVTDPVWARGYALRLPDPAARAGAFNQLSRVVEKTNWLQGYEDAQRAQRAARQEADPGQRALALVFVADRLTEMGADGQAEAIREASVDAGRLKDPVQKSYLLAELTTAAARYDLGLGRHIASEIPDEKLKKLAEARVNISEISQTTLTTRSKERVTALATAAAPYDSRGLPALLQLPAQDDVLKAIAAALPPIYPSAKPNITVYTLVRIWEYSKAAPQSVYKDQLQSRVARLMVLHDLWRGRDWGKQLAWKGGRIQVGAFLKSVLEYRQSHLKAGALQDIAKRNPERALGAARQLAPAAQVEALLLLAGQILG